MGENGKKAAERLQAILLDDLDESSSIRKRNAYPDRGR